MKREHGTHLVAFGLIAFGIAWASWLPPLYWPDTPKMVPLIGLFAPAIAAIIVGGRDGIRDLMRRLRRWRFSARWYSAAALLMPAVYTAAVVLQHPISGADLRRLWMGASPLFLAGSLAWLLFVTSGEEIGWRGYALPELLRLGMSPLFASLTLGVVWGLWHLPIYLKAGQSSIPYPLVFALMIGQSLIYTALYLRTKGSLLPAVLLHATTDFGPRLYRIDQFSSGTWTLIDAMVLLAGAAFLLSWKGSTTGSFLPPHQR